MYSLRDHEGTDHEGNHHEGTKHTKEKHVGIAAVSTLPAETEDLLTRIIGCGIEVHKRLGPGFFESIYMRALCYELQCAGLSYERERSIAIPYRDIIICGGRIDLIVEKSVVVEVKTVARLEPVHEAQVLSYLRSTRLRAGLLMNFKVALLKDGLQRIVL